MILVVGRAVDATRNAWRNTWRNMRNAWRNTGGADATVAMRAAWAHGRRLDDRRGADLEAGPLAPLLPCLAVALAARDGSGLRAPIPRPFSGADLYAAGDWRCGYCGGDGEASVYCALWSGERCRQWDRGPPW